MTAPRRVVVVGAGVGGLACALRLARAGHRVTVLEQGDAPGGKCGRLERDGFAFDTGPSLVTMPWVLRDLLGAELPELLRVEPVTRYAFADGTRVDLSADLPSAMEALEAWSPGAGTDWARFLGVCAGMWRASVPFLEGPPPWPPRRPVPDVPQPDPRDLLRVRPWHTLRTLGRSLVRDPRLRLVVERFATYAGADPRRAPAALAVAGYVEHAFGAWHPRGGVYELVRALVRALEAAGGELRLGVPVRAIATSRRRLALDGGPGRTRAAARGPLALAGAPGRARAAARGPLALAGERTSAVLGSRVTGVETDDARLPADVVVFNGDAAVLRSAAAAARRPRSLSGLALMLGLRGREPDRPHHEVRFPADYDAEFDDVFAHGRPVRDPTLYVSAPQVTDPGEAPADGESLFVLVNAPAAGAAEPDWDGYERALLARLGIAPERIAVRARRTPADLERETGAPGGAIYGAAPHGRLATLRRPPNRVLGVRGLWRVGGTTHPGGGLPLVMLSGKVVADEIARAA